MVAVQGLDLKIGMPAARGAGCCFSFSDFKTIGAGSGAVPGCRRRFAGSDLGHKLPLSGLLAQGCQDPLIALGARSAPISTARNWSKRSTTEATEVLQGAEAVITRGIFTARRDLRDDWHELVRISRLWSRIVHAVRQADFSRSATSSRAANLVWTEVPDILYAFDGSALIRSKDDL